MATLTLPPGYCALHGIQETEYAIKLLKDFFELNLSTELQLRRVTAPLLVVQGTGVNDDLNGVERPVAFPVKDAGVTAEVVQSLAKWKRMMLADYGIRPGYGLYTDMNALRPDETLDNTHSLYVDQWDWELNMPQGTRTLAFLRQVVRKIYAVLKRTEFFIYERYPEIEPLLPEQLTFVHAQDLLDQYPDKGPRERERAAVREHGALFIIGIGDVLSDGAAHDGRAPDYDDWSTPNEDGHAGFNGDLIIWNPVLQDAFELSSMGIRVDPAAMLRQLTARGALDRRELLFHRRLLSGELPQSIGGGIGQSRLCMYFLRKAHIGEIQAGLWPPSHVELCRQAGISLL